MSSERRVFDYPWSSRDRCTEVDDFANWDSDVFDYMIRDRAGNKEQFFCDIWWKLEPSVKARIYRQVVCTMQEDRENQKEASEA